MRRILIAAGASGGHVYPALVTANVLRDRGHEVVFAGGDRLEARLVPQAGFAFHALPTRRPPSVRIELVTPRGIRALGSIGRSTVRARSLVRELRPDAVLGMGGYAAVPVTLAAAWTRTKLVLHEQNARLSLAQRMPLRWADVLALSLPLEDDVRHRRTEIVGLPARPSISGLASLDTTARDRLRTEARTRVGLDPNAPTVLVFGGSIGSGPLNETVPRVRLPTGMQVLHLTGPGREHEVGSAWERSGVRARVVGYLDSMEDAYAAADLAVARSGASTVNELMLAGLPSVLVPLPTLARGDQEANARFLERAGAAKVILESDTDFAGALERAIERLLDDAQARTTMADAARSLARPDAATRLADVVEDAASASH